MTPPPRFQGGAERDHRPEPPHLQPELAVWRAGSAPRILAVLPLPLPGHHHSSPHPQLVPQQGTVATHHKVRTETTFPTMVPIGWRIVQILRQRRRKITNTAPATFWCYKSSKPVHFCQYTIILHL
jgi:hypothetical protein